MLHDGAQLSRRGGECGRRFSGRYRRGVRPNRLDRDIAQGRFAASTLYVLRLIDAQLIDDLRDPFGTLGAFQGQFLLLGQT